MVIDYTTQGKVVFTMFDYIKNMLNELPEGLDGTAFTPARNRLFEKNDNQTRVIPQEQEMFHNHVAKLLYLSKRAQPDIQNALYYLCTSFQNPDIDDMMKLIRTMEYMQLKQWLPLTLE